MKIRNFFRGVAAGGTVASIGALGVHGLVAVAQEFSVTPPYIAPPDIRAWVDGVLNRFPHPSPSPEVGPPQSDVFTLDQPTTMRPPELTEGGVVQAPVETPAAPFAGEGVAPEQVTPPVSGETAAQQVQGGEVPAPTAPVENASTLLEKLHETVPADIIDVDIRPGATVSEIIVANTDQAITWGPQDARVFGAHIGANYDLLRDMWEKMVAAGHETGSFMSFGEIEDLVEKAEQGDSAARLRLIKALHWIPAGQKFHILTKAGVRATMAALTVA